jgi:hypothetical protein
MVRDLPERFRGTLSGHSASAAVIHEHAVTAMLTS